MKRKITFLSAAFMLLAFLAVPLGMRGQTEVTWTASEQGYANAADVTDITIDNNISGTFAKATGNNAPKYYTTGEAVRMYTGNTLEVALNNQQGESRITAINFTFSGTYTGSLQNWTGSETSVSFTNTASGQARIQVIAVTYTEGGTAPTTYTVTYHANVTGIDDVVDTYIEGANVTLRAANTFTNEGYTFEEWNTDANGDGDAYEAGYQIEGIDEDLEFYAIWTENVTPGGDEQWVLTSLADLTANDVFVIVGNNGSNYAMSNNNGTGSAPAAVAVTIANDAITGTVADNIQWTIGGEVDNYIFYPNGSTETWLYCTSSNNGVRVGTNNANTFKMESGYLVHQGTSRYVGIYNSQDWRCYTTINNNIQGQSFAFYKKVTGGVLPPSISAGNVEISYETTSGSIAYTINNEPDPAGTISAEVTDGDWLTLGETPITFTCTVNEVATERTATVLLTYAYGDNQTVTKEVTVTQLGNPNVTPTIAEVRAQGTGNVVTRGIVTSCSGVTAYIQDATAAICVYGTELTVGDEIRVSGSLTTYNGLLEITSPQVTVISSGNTIEPQLMTVAEAVASENQGWYIRFEEVIVTSISGQNTTVAQGDATIVVRGISGVTYEVNDILSLNGNIGYYNGNQIANPQNVEVQAAPVEPSITLSSYSIEVTAEEAQGTLDIFYENLTITEANDFEIQYYNAQGEEIDEPDWISAEVNEKELSKNGTTYTYYEVTYVIDANEGEARTAYFKVYARDDETNLVYSNFVTINQEAYVAPALDYATLPFEFDGGRADIENTDGLTQEGLDSDYGSSPKLKFNTTGDWVLLHFNEEPGELAFDIKGNSFSGGTFTVQTSVDGETYEDLATYTELGSTEHETFNTLAADVRYIKWIYTEKVSGNVALGNITLAQPAAPVASITVDPAEVNVDAEEHDGTLALTYENLTISDMTDFDIQYYDAEGEETDEPDWVEVTVAEQDPQIGDGYVVSYYMMENEVAEARTAYFKVYAMDDDTELVYSNLVTISQAAPEVPVELENYALFTGDLIEGDYLIVYDGYAMNNVVSSGRLQYEEVEAENDVISTDNAAIIWHIAPTDGGYWTIYSADANAYAASTGAKNKAQMLEDGTDDKALWTITGTETFEFVNKANSEGGVNANLRNNGTYGFACYAATTGGALTLYKKVTTTATYTLEITGYGDSENGGYYLIASPIYGVNPANVEGMTDGEFDLYYFDQTQELEWINYETANGINHFYLTPGKGYLYAHKTDTTLTFTGAPYAGNGQIALTYDANAEFAGWNLVGNPFGEFAYVYDNNYNGYNFYIMNETGDEIVASEYNGVNAMQGIFVIAENDGETIYFETGGANIGGGGGGIDPGFPKGISLNITHNTNAVIDRAIVRFGEGRQLPKFQLNPNNTKVYVSQGTEDFAVVRSAAQGEMPVSFKAAQNGTYTISVNTENVEMNYLHLIDNMTSADVDLLVNPSYSFDASTTDYANRFRLVFSANGVEENTTTASDSFAYFNGSEWVISNMGEATLQVVDVMGRMLSTETINGNANISLNQVPGVYMIRLVNGNDVKVQKVVVK